MPTTDRAKHSPLPWGVAHDSNGAWIRSADGALVSLFKGSTPDASLLVRAVNVHAGLIALVEEHLAVLESVEPEECEWDDDEGETSLCRGLCRNIGCIAEKLKDARAALSRA